MRARRRRCSRQPPSRPRPPPRPEAAPARGSGRSPRSGAAVLVFTLVRLRGGLRRATHSISDISDGRELLIARGRRVTEALTSLADAVAEREDEGASKQHQRALDAVASARSRIGRASGPRVMAKAHEELDEAEWLIGVLGARLDGFVEPLRPRDGTAGDLLLRRRARSRDRRGRPRGHRACSASPCAPARPAPSSLVRGERPRVGSVSHGRPRAALARGAALVRLLRLGPQGSEAPALRRHPALRRSRAPVGQRRQTVAERARGVRARVLPARPRCCPRTSDELDEASRTTSTAFEPRTTRARARRAGRAGHAAREPRRSAPGAFAAMEGEASDRDRDGARRGQRHRARVGCRSRGPAGAAAAAR